MSSLGRYLRAVFALPHYLALPLSGVDLSTSSIKAVRLVEGVHGFVMAGHADVKLPSGACANGEVVDATAVAAALAEAVATAHIGSANVAVPESKSFLFETAAAGANAREWRVIVEQHLDELIPLPPPETDFDIIKVGRAASGDAFVTGVGVARRIVDDTLSIFDHAHIPVRAIESETFAMTRALLPYGDTSTVFIIDIGKATTKMVIAEGRVPRFAATVGIGGHALTLAVQKHFGVTEADARKIKAERGIIPAPGNEDYLGTMLSTVSAIRDEIATRLDYWQKKAAQKGPHEPVARAILVGGNASVRGLPEYLEGSLHIPVVTGDVFTNCASRDTWMPSLSYAESLAYATAVGLALYNYTGPYA